MNIELINNISKLNEFKKSLPPINQVLYNRGVEDYERFFDHSPSLLQSPYGLDNISLAANKIIHHCKNSATIAVLVDCDADGLTSSATLINYLDTFSKENDGWDGNHPSIVPLLHEGKEHGLSDTKIMKQLRDLVQPALLIIPDASGTDLQYAALTNIGIDIVVLDHHDTSERGDGETVIVVNNQQSANYLNKNLSGVGVVYQLCRVFDDILSANFANDSIELVAVGLIADVMDLRSPETRYLIREGLANIHSPFLKQAAVTLAYSLGGEYNPTNVAFYISPLFNAVLRIGTAEEKELIFKSLLISEACSEIESGKRGCQGELVPLVEEALRQATNAKARQKRRQDKLTELIGSVIVEEQLIDNKVFVLAIDDFDNDQRTLSGLIANKIQDYYQRPCILVFNNNDGSYSGSCRAPDKIRAFSEFRTQCLESNLTNYSAGHPQAFGISISKKNIPLLQEYFNNKYLDVDVEPTYYCDFCLDADDPELSGIIRQLSGNKCWGHGVSEPLIAVNNVKIGRPSLTLLSAAKNPTLKITLPNGVVCIKFHSSQEEFDSICLPLNNENVEQYFNATIVGKASANEWQGNITPQILVENYEIHDIGYMF